MEINDSVKITIGPDKGRIGTIVKIEQEENFEGKLHTIITIKIGKFKEQYDSKYLKKVS